jgi:hypothetical protein
MKPFLWALPNLSLVSVDFLMPAEFHFNFDSSELIDPYNQNAKEISGFFQSCCSPS